MSMMTLSSDCFGRRKVEMASYFSDEEIPWQLRRVLSSAVVTRYSLVGCIGSKRLPPARVRAADVVSPVLYSDDATVCSQESSSQTTTPFVQMSDSLVKELGTFESFVNCELPGD